MSRPLDLLILGGGCAGLSLARRLAALGNDCPQVEIIERRSHYANDRSWCFWAEANNSASQSWARFRLRWGARSVECCCGSTPYQLIRSDLFYQQAIGEIAPNRAVTVTLNTAVIGEVVRNGQGYCVETTQGSRQARWVIDTRPAVLPVVGGATLWQSFLGWEIEAEHAMFESSVADLMDFELGSSAEASAVSFVYVLPLSSTRALIEPTVFSREPQSLEQLTAMMYSVLATRLGNVAYTILRRETGVLPMGLVQTHSTVSVGTKQASFEASGYLRAGLAAGAARPSTGYAFTRIQHWADACASRIGDGQEPCPQPRDPVLLRAMDHLFLLVLRNQPRIGPRLFFTLFTAVRTERVIRFLSDRATKLDLLCIVLALPARPFFRELWRRLWSSAGAQP